MLEIRICLFTNLDIIYVIEWADQGLLQHVDRAHCDYK